MLAFGILFEKNKENITDSIKKERFKTQPTNDSKNARACRINHVNITKIMGYKFQQFHQKITILDIYLKK